MCNNLNKKKKKTNENWTKLGRILEGPKGGQFTKSGGKGHERGKKTTL